MSEADLSETQPPEIQPYQTRHLLRVAIAAAAVAFAGGIIVTRFDDVEMLRGLPRTALAVAAVALLQWVSEIRLERRLSQMRTEQAEFQAGIKARLNKAEYAEGFVDGVQRRPPDERHLRSV